jgi:hypothetical protein
VDFPAIINKCRGGALNVELSETFLTLAKACIDTGKAGEIKLIIKIEPEQTKDGGHIFKMTPKVEAKNPKFDTGVSFLHVVTDESGAPVELLEEDPRQAKLFEAFERTKQ